MPYYLYQNPKTQKIKEIFQHMKDKHVYVENGLEWERVFNIPQTRIDALSDVNPFDKQEFIERTGRMKNIKHGDLWDLSAELSRKRAKALGKDPVKEKAAKDYSKKCGGKPHPHA
jgi:hypothetical protein